MSKRLIIVSTLSVLFVAIVISYGLYKINQIEKDNVQLRDQIESRDQQVKDEVSATSTLEDRDVTGSSTKEVGSQREDVEEGETVVEKEIVYVTREVTKEALNPESEKPEMSISETESVEAVLLSEENKEPEVKVISVRQAQYPDEYGGTYGSYEIELSVVAKGGEILIPETTTDTIGASVIGFSYSIVGDDFHGVQDSKITCFSKTGDYCKFKDDGKARNIVATVFLTPYEDGTGNYAVLFENLSYYQNDEKKSFEINRKTSTINIMY